MEKPIEAMIEKYVAAWNPKTPDEYRAAFKEIWAEDATYTDPTYENLAGVDAIASLAVQSLAKFPGRRFEVATSPEYHHNVGRYTWKVVFADGSTHGGFDYFEFNEAYQLTRIVSFF